MPSELQNEARLLSQKPKTKLENYLLMNTLKAFLPTIKGWVTRKGVEFAGYSGITITAWYKAKEIQLVEILQAQQVPADQIALAVEQTSNLVTQGVALLPSLALILISIIFSRIAAKQEEK